MRKPLPEDQDAFGHALMDHFPAASEPWESARTAPLATPALLQRKPDPGYARIAKFSPEVSYFNENGAFREELCKLANPMCDRDDHALRQALRIMFRRADNRTREEAS